MMFQPNEIAPQCFYFTYSLQEHERFITFLNETDSSNTLISSWNDLNSENFTGKYKVLDANYSNSNGLIDNRSYYLVNSLWSTMKWCVGEYAKYNNINVNYELDKSFNVYKIEQQQHIAPSLDNENGNVNDLTIRFFLNDSYVGGEFTAPEYNRVIKPEAGSIIINKSTSLINGKNQLISGDIYYAEARAIASE